MQHGEILKELYSLERFGIKLGTENITDLLRRVGDPQLQFPAVHVTGSNGKGSVCAFIESILREAGCIVGLYTSPHLIRFNERIRVGGWELPDEHVARLYEAVRPHAAAMASESRAKQPTFFEVTTAMAFLYFAEKKVDVAVVEVGMGGGMDATNVVRPEACVLTRIGLEHTDHLGKTVKRIAREKAGILKPGVPVVTVDQEALPTVEDRAKELGCAVTAVGRDVTYRRLGGSLTGQEIEYSGPPQVRVETSMLGAHQAENVAIALTAATAIESSGREIGERAMTIGIARTRWPARFHLVRRSPPVIIDGAHNPSGAESLGKSIEEYFPRRKVVFVAGVLGDKDLAGIVSKLAPLASHVVATRPKSERAFPPEEVAEGFMKDGVPVEVAAVPVSAIRRGLELASSDRPLVIAGSLYLAGEALDHFQGGIR